MVKYQSCINNYLAALLIDVNDAKTKVELLENVIEFSNALSKKSKYLGVFK